MDKRAFAAILFLVSALLGAGAAYAAGYSADFSLAQHEVSTCPAGGGQLIFAMIKNTGTSTDSYWISATKDWVEMPEVTLAPGEETRVGVLVAIGDPTVVPAKYAVELTLHSSKSKSTYKDTINVKTLDCPGVLLQPRTETVSGCAGEELRASILLKNPGNIKDTFELSASKGWLSNSTVALESGEVKEIFLGFSPQAGSEEITVSAASKVSYAKAGAKITFAGRNCYASQLSVVPDYVKACMVEGAAFAVKISNTGEKADTFSISSNAGNLSANNIEVPANSTRTIVLSVVPGKAGIQEIKVDAASPNARHSAKAEIEGEKCYSFGMSLSPQNLRTENYSGMISNVVIANTGTRQDKYTVSLGGTPWMEIAPESITVEPNSSKGVYIYITPVFGVANGTYTANVVATSAKSGEQISKQLEFVFGAGGAGDITASPATGAATKAVSKKVIYALIIGLAIVLVILFGREFRKMSKRDESEDRDESDAKRPDKKEKKQGRKAGKKTDEDIKDILEGI